MQLPNVNAETAIHLSSSNGWGRVGALDKALVDMLNHVH